MVEASKRQAHRCQRRVVATSLATQTLLPGPTGRHWMKSVPYLSSHDGSGWVQLEGFGPTRNRKVEGSSVTVGPESRWVARHWPLAVWENAAPGPLHGFRYAGQASCTGTPLPCTDPEERVSRRYRHTPQNA